MAGLGLKDRVRSSDLRERLREESLLLSVERSGLRWFGHLVRMPPFHWGGVSGMPVREETWGQTPGHAGDIISHYWLGNAWAGEEEWGVKRNIQIVFRAKFKCQHLCWFGGVLVSVRWVIHTSVRHH